MCTLHVSLQSVRPGAVHRSVRRAGLWLQQCRQRQQTMVWEWGKTTGHTNKQKQNKKEISKNKKNMVRTSPETSFWKSPNNTNAAYFHINREWWKVSIVLTTDSWSISQWLSVGVCPVSRWLLWALSPHGWGQQRPEEPGGGGRGGRISSRS